MTLLNIFNSGGLWVIPCVTLIVFFITLFQAYKSSRSGSLRRKDENSKWVESKENIPIYQTPRFYWSLCWLAATGILLWWLIIDYKGV